MLSSVNEIISQLLPIQEIDYEVVQVTKQLGLYPDRVAKAQSAVEVKIAEQNEAKKTLQGLELRRQQQREERRAKEALVQKLLGQQGVVKKNEEYQALEKEIAHTRTLIAEMEEVELGTLMAIDEETERLDKINENFEQELSLLQKEVERVEAEQSTLVDAARLVEKKLEDERAKVSPEALSHYDRMRKSLKSLPVVAKLEGQTCGGCHLKVSADVISEVRAEENITYCDKCGRILIA